MKIVLIHLKSALLSGCSHAYIYRDAFPFLNQTTDLDFTVFIIISTARRLPYIKPKYLGIVIIKIYHVTFFKPDENYSKKNVPSEFENIYEKKEYK